MAGFGGSDESDDEEALPAQRSREEMAVLLNNMKTSRKQNVGSKPFAREKKRRGLNLSFGVSKRKKGTLSSVQRYKPVKVSYIKSFVQSLAVANNCLIPHFLVGETL